ncbi:MAG: penicillin-binding protein activator [Burkholderiales bacterium]
MARFATGILARLAIVAIAGAAAFSAAQSPPASEPAAEQPAPAAAAAPPPPPVVDIALILPLEVPAYARAAEAVRAGFLAAAETVGIGAKTRVFGHGEDGVLAAFEAAQMAGARVIVGPLVRDDVKVVATMAIDLPWTIALNQLEEGGAAPANLYTFALSVDSDARLIAQRIRADTAPGTVPNVVVIGAETPLMKRFSAAFAAEWMAAGGSVPGLYAFEGTPTTMSAMRRDLARKAPDAALLALDSGGAALAKPYLGTVATYASGLVFERETAAVVRDLDGLTLTEIPWIVTPGAPQFAQLPKREFPSAALTRLYALGLDAFRVAQAFRDGAPERFTLDGATGHVTLVEGRQFAREGRFAVFRAGQLTPVDGPR